MVRYLIMTMEATTESNNNGQFTASRLYSALRKIEGACMADDANNFRVRVDDGMRFRDIVQVGIHEGEIIISIV